MTLKSQASSNATFHALVTGATGGIGRGICLSLIDMAKRERRQIRLSICSSQDGPRVVALASELRGLGAQVHTVAGDVTNPEQCRMLVEQSVEPAGGMLHALICSAGSSVAGRLADLSVEEWDQAFNLNVRSVWLMAQAARPYLVRSRGSITAVASMSGLYPHPGLGAYSPAKAALVMLCRQLAQDWATEGIRTNSVCPGMIRTPLTESIYLDEATLAKREAIVPLGRIGTAEDVGGAVAYLASEAASYINGVNLLVDGGVTDHMMAMIPGRPKRA